MPSYNHIIIQIFAITYKLEVPFNKINVIKNNNDEEYFHKYQLFVLNEEGKLPTIITKP